MPIAFVARNGPPEAMRCPMLLCDACGGRIQSGDGKRDPEAQRLEDRPGISVSWARYVDGDRPAPDRLESSPTFFVHKGRCDRAFQKYVEQFYRLDDGWTNGWDDVANVFAQLSHNMTHPFEDDPDLGTEKVLYYPPARIVNLLPTDGHVITPKWSVGESG